MGGKGHKEKTDIKILTFLEGSQVSKTYTDMVLQAKEMSSNKTAGKGGTGRGIIAGKDNL